MNTPQTRRRFLKTSAVAGAMASIPWYTSVSHAVNYRSPNERPVLGCIGTGSRWDSVGPQALKFSDCAGVCDVDTAHMDKALARVQKAQGTEKAVVQEEDYQKILDRNDVDLVTIVTTDHWHSKIAIEAMQAGKDVYCEKPLTLTIHEGKQIIKVLDETNRVFQVGTQQRTDMGQRFLQAIAMIRNGRVGDVKELTCNIGGVGASGPIPAIDPPKTLNWEKWLGQAPLTPYRFTEGGRWGKTNGHYEFRWWYQYSGGKMTDWGAHHVDIGQWMIQQDQEGTGPVKIEPIMAEHPTKMVNGMPTQDDCYNVASKFHVKVTFSNGVVMNIVSHSDDGNGILVEGTKGRFHVSRSRIKGRPFEELESNPLPEGAIAEVYRGKQPTTHMQNFFDCVKSRELPISDVYSHHRAMTTCHLANIAIRLNRTLEWDPNTQQIIGDAEANMWQSREQRKGYEINVPV